MFDSLLHAGIIGKANSYCTTEAQGTVGILSKTVLEESEDLCVTIISLKW